MAQLDIERKSGTNWLVWLIGIILLALIIWWLVELFDDDAAVVTDPVATTTAPVAAPAPVTDAGMITDWNMLAGDRSALIGRQVALSSVPVLDVVSDRGFWVGTGEADRLFAIRTRQAAPGTPPDGAVNAGQTVALYGMVTAMPTDLTQQTTAWNLESTDAQALAGQTAYVEVDSVRIIQAAQ